MVEFVWKGLGLSFCTFVDVRFQMYEDTWMWSSERCTQNYDSSVKGFEGYKIQASFLVIVFPASRFHLTYAQRPLRVVPSKSFAHQIKVLVWILSELFRKKKFIEHLTRASLSGSSGEIKLFSILNLGCQLAWSFHLVSQTLCDLNIHSFLASVLLWKLSFTTWFGWMFFSFLFFENRRRHWSSVQDDFS